MIFGVRKLESWGYRAALYNTGVWQTDTQRHRHTTTVYTALSIASRGRNLRALASAIPEIWWEHPKYKTSRDVTTSLSWTVCRPSAGTSYDQHVHQIWSLYVNSLRRYERRRKMVMGHPRSSETSPFDRSHMTSYSTLIETRNAWQSLAYSPLGTVVSPPSEYLWKTLTYWSPECLTAPSNSEHR